MATQQLLRWCYIPDEKTPVYSQPTTDSGIKDFLISAYSNIHYLVTMDSRPGWLFVVDLILRSQSGGVQSDKLTVAEPDEHDRRETGYLFVLHLGANIQEIISRWSGVKIAARTVTVSSVNYDGDETWNSVTVNTLMTGEGFELNYEDHRNFSIMLT